MKNQAKRQKDLSALKSKVPPAPVFILVRPQMAENIGMAARAMMNCGIYDLRVVAPKELPDDEKALAASSGADPILKGAKIFDSLNEAVADLSFVLATTARARHISKTVVRAGDIGAYLGKTDPAKAGILFGCERTGLENDELECADVLLTIPLNPEHTSLNLSQAVLLVGYECLKALHKGDLKAAKTPENPLASKAEIQVFLDKLNAALTQKGYYNLSEKRPKMQQNLDNIFLKSGLKRQEVRTLHGVLNFLLRDKKE